VVGAGTGICGPDPGRRVVGVGTGICGPDPGRRVAGAKCCGAGARKEGDGNGDGGSLGWGVGRLEGGVSKGSTRGGRAEPGEEGAKEIGVDGEICESFNR
jgi:hypothetical protein